MTKHDATGSGPVRQAGAQTIFIDEDAIRLAAQHLADSFDATPLTALSVALSLFGDIAVAQGHELPVDLHNLLA